MPDDVETLQKMVRWFAEKLVDEEEAHLTYRITESQWEKYVEGRIHDARRAVADG